MYFITTKRMLEVCFSAHPNIQYRTFLYLDTELRQLSASLLTPLSTVQELHAPADASTSPSLISITHYAPPFAKKE